MRNDRRNRKHETLDHGLGEYERGQLHTNSMASFQSMRLRGGK